MSVLQCILVWSVAILQTTDGASITWYLPPPVETVTDDTVTFTSFKNLSKGSLNEELSFNFSLSADLSLSSITIELDGVAVGGYLSVVATPSVRSPFIGRFNVSWVPTKLTLIVLNVTSADKGRYRCKVESGGVGVLKQWKRTIEVDVFVQPNITYISPYQMVDDGDVLRLNCERDGNPRPRITWTRLSSNSVVSMPMNITGKQDEGVYRCTADNGIGITATADVFVFVQSYRPFNTVFSTNLTNATLLNTTFYLMCSAEANPAAEFTLYKKDESLGNFTAGSQNISLIFPTSVNERVKEVTYICIPFNSFGDGPTETTTVTVHYPVEATGNGTNHTVAKGEAKNLSCPVDGNPEPNIKWYKGSEASGNLLHGETVLILKDVRESACYTCVASNSVGKPVSLSFCLTVDPNLTTVSSTMVSRQSTKGTTSAPPTTKQPNPTSAEPDPDGTLWIIIGCATGGVLVLAICVLTWWVHNKRKCRKDAKIHNSDLERHDGAYAQSGPPAANGTDGAADEQIGAEAAIPTYAAVDKSKKSKKQADERPPEYAVVDKSKKTEKQEAAAIPTYAAVDKSKKKKKKSHEEVPAVYAEVDKSKKKKKKKIDDKNLYENLDEPKKEKKPGELLYADLGDFQNPSMPTVSTSPQPLPAIKKADPYERTDYADITQFFKGNATLPPNDGNGDTEMKPKRPSKNKIQGNDKETPI